MGKDKTFKFEIDESPYLKRSTTIEELAELEEFLRLEKEAEEYVEEQKRRFIEDLQIPNFEDTLEEVDFILQLEDKLKKFWIEGKNYFTPPLENFYQTHWKSTKQRSNSTSCATPHTPCSSKPYKRRYRILLA